MHWESALVGRLGGGRLDLEHTEAELPRTHRRFALVVGADGDSGSRCDVPQDCMDEGENGQYRF